MTPKLHVEFSLEFRKRYMLHGSDFCVWQFWRIKLGSQLAVHCALLTIHYSHNATILLLKKQNNIIFSGRTDYILLADPHE